MQSRLYAAVRSSADAYLEQYRARSNQDENLLRAAATNMQVSAFTYIFLQIENGVQILLLLLHGGLTALQTLCTSTPFAIQGIVFDRSDGCCCKFVKFPLLCVTNASTVYWVCWVRPVNKDPAWCCCLLRF